MRAAALLAALLLGVAQAGSATAATIAVGPERTIKLPSQALKSAEEGDTIAIDTGEYYDCMRVGTAGLTIVGLGAGAVLTDTTCDGKAIIVAGAPRLTLRNLTLQRARVGDGNGAGIRAEGGDITIDKVQFLNDQAGLIAGDIAGATIAITDSRFDGTGVCEGASCASAISVGRIARLRIDRSLLTGTRGAHQIISGAAITEILASRIEDGPKGFASFQLLVPNGGSLLLEGNIFQKGPRAANLRAAILIDGDITGPITIRRNTFLNETKQVLPFIINWSDGGPTLEGNTITPRGTEIASDGFLKSRAGNILRDLKQSARGVARTLLGR